MGLLNKLKTKMKPTKSKVIVLTGGLNEGLSNLELKPGDLTECTNYVEVSGVSHGYTSYPGYERYDGTALASSVSITLDADGNVTSDTAREARRTAILPIPGTGQARGVWQYNNELFAVRDIDGSNAGVYKASDWSWADTEGTFKLEHAATGTDFVKDEVITGSSSGATGVVNEIEGVSSTWTIIEMTNSIRFEDTEAVTGSIAGSKTLTDVTAVPLNSIIGVYSAVVQQFVVGEEISGDSSGAVGTVVEVDVPNTTYTIHVHSETPFQAEPVTGDAGGNATLALPVSSSLNAGGTVRTAIGRFADYKANAEICTIVDGVSDPHLLYKASNDHDILIPIVESAGTLPSTYPTHVGIWKNRLFLAYPGGHLFFSIVGDPTGWDATSNAGEIYVGEDITDIQQAPGGALIVSTKNKIRIISYNSPSTGTSVTDEFIFSMEEFSEASGSISGTMKRMLGTLYFCDDRGVTTLEAAQEFGDFKADKLTKKVEKTYQSLRRYITATMVDREKAQYTVWFNRNSNNAVGLVFTFNGKFLRGTGYVSIPNSIYCTSEGKDSFRNDLHYFGDSNGYIHKMKSGTSFDGDEIITGGATSFYHFGSPQIWKHFKRLIFEVSAPEYTQISYRADFDYSNSRMPLSEENIKRMSTGAGIWGAGVWGTFTWGSEYLKQVFLRIIGYGGNMRVAFSSVSKYKAPHTIHNIIVEYSKGSNQIG